jgi:hypothetical protein
MKLCQRKIEEIKKQDTTLFRKLGDDREVAVQETLPPKSVGSNFHEFRLVGQR